MTKNHYNQPFPANASIALFQNNPEGDGEHIEIRPDKYKNETKWIWILLSLIILLLLSIGIIVFVVTKTQSNPRSTVISTKKVLFIIVDGIPADVLENSTIPNLRQIGNYKRAYVGGENGTYTETPTISAPGYMDIITGTWGNKHNVSDNEVNDPNYNYKNLFRLVKEQTPNTKIGIFSTWIDNRLKLVGEGLPSAGNIIFDYKFDGYELDETTYSHNSTDYYTREIDQRVVNETVKCMENDAPDVSWVYLQYTDDVGHEYGDSPQLYQSIENLDQQIGQIDRAIQSRRKFHHEDWLIIVTTDHGRDPITGQDHGAQSERERTTWLIMNSNKTNRYFRDFTPAAIDLLPTMARFLNLNIPVESSRELDGVPLIGKVSLIQPELDLSNEILVVRWKALDDEGNVSIWLSTTNLFKTGSKDDYQFLGSVPVGKQLAQFNIQNYPSQYYKVVLEGRYNTVNKWLIIS